MDKAAQARIDAENSALLSEIFAADDRGIYKTASSPRLKEWFQTYLRNDGTARRMMDPEPITADEFAHTDDSIDPYVIRTIQPHSAGAIGVPFDTGTAQAYMHANKYRIYLMRLFTPSYRIDKIYLEAYRGPLVDVFKDLMMMDLLQQEDQQFVDLSETQLPQKGEVNPDLDVKQYIELGDFAQMPTTTLAEALKGMSLSLQNLSVARTLIQRSLWWDIIATLRSYEQSPGLVEKTLFGNTEALEENLWGVKWVTALSRKLVPYRTMYMYTEPSRLGDFLTFGEAAIYSDVEQGIILKMNAHETIGMNMPNPGAVFKVDFTPGATPDTWLGSESSN